MKTLLLFFCLIVAQFSRLPFVHAEEAAYLEAPKDWIDYDVDAIIKSDPTQISEEQYYNYEYAIIAGSSGSGGYFLDEDEIIWLKKVETALVAKGVELKDPNNRAGVFGGSYFNMQNYKKAIEEYRGIGEGMGAEDAEWVLNNGEIKNGIVKIEEYPGKNPSNGTTEIAVVEDEQYLFVSYFKGAVYRYDKINDKHAVIYAPEFQYDWVDSLKWDGQRLTIGLRDNAGVFEFENATNILKKKS